MKVNHGYVRRLDLTPKQAETLAGQGHAARALWNLLNEWWRWGGRTRRPTLKQADEAIRQARTDIPWLADLPAQASPGDPEPTRFQTIELPPQVTVVTEYQGHARTCPCCGDVTRARCSQCVI